MSVLDLYKKHYEAYCSCDWGDDVPSKYEWIANETFNLCTYDGALDELFVKKIIEVAKAILDDPFEYVKISQTDYINFIAACQVFNQFHWIEWGTSIRGAWFCVDNRWPPRKILERLDIKQYDEHGNLKDLGVEGVEFTVENLKTLIKFLEEDES